MTGCDSTTVASGINTRFIHSQATVNPLFPHNKKRLNTFLPFAHLYICVFFKLSVLDTVFTFNEVGHLVLLHVLLGVVEADVVHLRGQEVPAVHGGSQQRVDAGRPGA